MKYQVLFCLKNNEKVFINSSAAVVIGGFRVNESLINGFVKLTML